MTIDTIGVYWKARNETAEQCATRLHNFLSALDKEFPRLSKWFEKGTTKQQAMTGKAINELDSPGLLELVKKGANKRKSELGYILGFWNQEQHGVSAGLGISCGIYTDNPNLSNAVYIKLPGNLSTLAIDTDAAQQRCLELMAAVWDADWGAVYDVNGSAIKNRGGNGPFLDKYLWVKKAQSESPFDESVMVKKLENGVLYVR